METNNKNKIKESFTTSEVIILVIMTFIIGISIGNLTHNKIKTTKTSGNDEYISEFINNYNYIVDNYYDEVNKKELIDSAISGMMKSLDDPYSVYFDEAESENFNITLDGSYRGIGVQITKNDETKNITIVSVFKDSPAFKAGLKVSDEIKSVNGQSSIDMSTSDFSSFVRSKDNTSLDFVVIRDGKEINITLKKDNVVLDSVTSKIIERNNKKIGYIYIGIFASNTDTQFISALNELKNKKMDSLIIDVRSNSGGHLTSVNNILETFLNSKQIMYQFNQNGKITKIYGKGKKTIDYDIVLLGNEASASASEVLISSLMENLNSKFIGKKTYGKGTVQEMIKLSDGTQYKLTVKKWLTPTGKWINDTKGIVPDIEVDLDQKYFETLQDSYDTQLEKAIEVLSSEK